MRTNAAKFVVEPVQILAQESNNLHAEIPVFAQKRKELMAWNKDRRRWVACLGGDPVISLAHALTQSEYGSGTSNFQ